MLIILIILIIVIVLLYAKPKMEQREKNIKAFLKVIQFTEGTAKKKNPYAVTYAYSHNISDFSDHPTNLGNWFGIRLSDKMCINAGKKPGCKSTAAGAYQIIQPTWNTIKKAIKGIKFDEKGQDTAAIYLIKKTGALADIENGNFKEAVAKCAKVWSSFPGNPYSQPTKKIAEMERVFTNNGGKIV